MHSRDEELKVKIDLTALIVDTIEFFPPEFQAFHDKLDCQCSSAPSKSIVKPHARVGLIHSHSRYTCPATIFFF